MNAGTRQYAIVTAAYWGFTLTDGALRMLVLLHFYKLGYSPFTLAFLFLLYEAAGVLANLIGGWLATRYGIARMLTVGLATQICGFLLLSALSPHWGATFSVAWVVVAQGLCGVAKDLTKTASKSAIKLTAGSASGQLFKWVAFFTGSKNAMKGVGFFLGGVLLQLLGFQASLWLMAGLLSLVLIGVIGFVPPLMGKSRASASARELFAKNRGINLLAGARVALFGARDVWFVVGVPVFLYASGWTFSMVGAYLAMWTIGYGVVQALAPALVKRSPDGLTQEVPAARAWSAALALIPAALAALVYAEAPHLEWVIVVGLGLFGFAFAVNSSIHSYLVLAYAGSEKAAEDVGFYYAANALGRFFGTLMSGLLYQWGGIGWSLIGSAIMLGACWSVTLLLPTHTQPSSALGTGRSEYLPRGRSSSGCTWMGLFERFLTVWVALGIMAGVLLGLVMPATFQWVASLEVAHVNLIVAVLIWVMIYPMMVQIDWSSVKDVGQRPAGLYLTLVVNWLFKPFTMAALGVLFFQYIFAPWVDPASASEYIAGMILLGVAPCTAMVFVWSQLVQGNANYTLVQVSVNDLIMVVAFAPIAAFLLGVTDVAVPWETLVLSTVLYVVLPLLAGLVTRRILRDAPEGALARLSARLKPWSVVGLIATVVLLFGFQAQTLVARPLVIGMIAVPLVLQSYGIFMLGWWGARLLKLPHDIAGPACLIGTSNFFELAVAVAISLFGLQSGAALATVVGVLVEVPVMLSLVWLINRMRPRTGG